MEGGIKRADVDIPGSDSQRSLPLRSPTGAKYSGSSAKCSGKRALAGKRRLLNLKCTHRCNASQKYRSLRPPHRSHSLHQFLQRHLLSIRHLLSVPGGLYRKKIQRWRCRSLSSSSSTIIFFVSGPFLIIWSSFSETSLLFLLLPFRFLLAGKQSVASRSPGVGQRLAVKQVDDQFVGGHHDGRVGDLAHQVGGEAAVQRAVALLPRHREQRVEEGAVAAALLS